MAAACLLMAAAAAAAVATPVTDASKACLAPSLMGVPMPFAERESRAFVDAPIMTKLPQTGAKAETAVVPRAIMAELYAARKEQLCARLRENATLVRLMLEATADGFVAGALGLDARVPFARRRQSNSSSSEDVLGWAPLRALRDAYYDDPDWSSVTNLSAPARAFASWPVATLGASTHQLSEAFWALDTEARTTAERAVRAQLGDGAAGAGASLLYDGLARDGFVLVDRWAPLDFGRLRRVAMRALDRAAERQSSSAAGWAPTVKAHAPEVERLLAPLLANESLVRAVRAYLNPAHTATPAVRGASARGGCCSFGYLLLRLAANMSGHEGYVSSHWHHDRAGRRLKLFIFLHDVDPAAGRPTLVARGTHDHVWWSAAWVQDSRFDDAWVRAAHDVVPMGGRGGGGFVFDTNSIHKGEHLGAFARSVVIVELDRPGRCRALRLGRAAAAAARTGERTKPLATNPVPCGSSTLAPAAAAAVPGRGTLIPDCRRADAGLN